MRPLVRQAYLLQLPRLRSLEIAARGLISRSDLRNVWQQNLENGCEHKLDRPSRNGKKIAARLDCEAWHVEPTGWPKNMRRETYAALKAKQSKIAEKIY